MIVIPSRNSIDAWQELGNPGWNFDAMVPYYHRFHTFHEPSSDMAQSLGLNYLDPNIHGRSGPIQIGYGTYRPEVNEVWTQTFSNIGQTPSYDPFTGKHFGGYNAPCSIDPLTSNRSYAAAYLNEDVIARPNLRIVTEARVELLILNNTDQGRQAIQGVQFVNLEEKQLIVHCTDVVLGAGVFGSPQLLELSGIGDSSFLASKGISSKVHLPGVGENLQDHSNVGISFESNKPTFDSFRDPNVIGAAFKEYQESKTGPMANSTLGAAYLPYQASEEMAATIAEHIADGPDFPAKEEQYRLIRSTIEDSTRSSIEYLLAPAQLTVQQSAAATQLDDEAKGADYITVYSSLSHPFSRGTVHITSRDPRIRPAVDPRYFSHQIDVEVVARHLMYLETLTRTQPLASMIKQNGRRIPQNIDLTNIEAAKEAIKTGFTTYHPCGTCAMMPRDKGGVVDERLNVHGVDGLKVVDASVFPLIPRGNIMATVYAVAEKAADLLKEDWSSKTNEAK